MRKTVVVLCSCVAFALSGRAALKELKPGWNLFSPQQDIQLGREASAEIANQKVMVHNARLDAYVARIGHILAQSPHAGKWPYEFHVLNDKNVNAFALPGGFVYVNTGAIEACDNEAQLAAVMAHEMSHVNLRHGTHQITKAAPVELASMLAGALFGRSMLGQLARAGIGLTAGSVLLKFSRDAESEADYNGVEIMADVGYNPLEMAHFFEKLEAKGGQGNSRLAQFLSDHPNPGNRVAAIQQEVREIPQKRYVTSKSSDFPAIKEIALRIPPPDKRMLARPSSDLREYDGRGFTMLYPSNWQVLDDDRSKVITIASPTGIVQTPGGDTSIGYGLETSYYEPDSNTVDLDRDTQAFIRQLGSTNPDLRAGRSEPTTVAGRRALATVLHTHSPFPNEMEIDWLLTTARPDGLFYILFVTPEKEFETVRPILDRIVQSVHFN